MIDVYPTQRLLSPAQLLSRAGRLDLAIHLVSEDG